MFCKYNFCFFSAGSIFLKYLLGYVILMPYVMNSMEDRKITEKSVSIRFAIARYYQHFISSKSMLTPRGGVGFSAKIYVLT